MAPGPRSHSTTPSPELVTNAWPSGRSHAWIAPAGACVAMGSPIRARRLDVVELDRLVRRVTSSRLPSAAIWMDDAAPSTGG